MRILLLIMLVLCIPNPSFAQCFSSSGNPIGGSYNMGVIPKNIIRVKSFYKHSYSGRYFYEDKLNTVELITASKAIYNYIGSSVGYGLNERISVEGDLGYFIDKTKYFTSPLKGYGFSNLQLSSKINFFRNTEKRFEITGGAGIKIPLHTKEQQLLDKGIVINNHPDVQPSIGSYGLMGEIYVIRELPFSALRFFFVTMVDYNFKSNKDFFDKRRYHFGPTVITSAFVSKHIHFGPSLEFLTQHWTTILQIRGEWKGVNKIQALDIDENNNTLYGTWETVKNSGNAILFLTPQLNYTIAESWNVSFLVDIPLYQYYNGIQLATDYAYVINVSKDI